MPNRDTPVLGAPRRPSGRRSKTTSSVSTAFQEIGEKCAELQNLIRHHQLNFLYRSAADPRNSSPANPMQPDVPSHEEEDDIIAEITNILTDHTRSLNIIIKDLKFARDQSARARSLSAQLQEHRRLRRALIKSPSLSDPPHMLRKRTTSIPQLVKLVDKSIDRVDVGATRPLNETPPNNTTGGSHPWRQLVAHGEPNHAQSSTTSSTTEVEPFIYVANRARPPSKSTTPRAVSPPTVVVPSSVGPPSPQLGRRNLSAYRPSGIPIRKKPMDPDATSDSGASVMTAKEYLATIEPEPSTNPPTPLRPTYDLIQPSTPLSRRRSPTHPADLPIPTLLPNTSHTSPPSLLPQITAPPHRPRTPRQINPKIQALMQKYTTSHPALPFPLPEPLHVTRHGKEVSVDEHPQNWMQHDPARRPLPVKKVKA